MKILKTTVLFVCVTVMCYSCSDRNYEEFENEIELQQPSEDEDDDAKGVPGQG